MTLAYKTPGGRARQTNVLQVAYMVIWADSEGKVREELLVVENCLFETFERAVITLTGLSATDPEVIWFPA